MDSVRTGCVILCCALGTPNLCTTPSAVAQRVEPTVVSEAPPLQWPTWLVNIDGAQLAVKQGVDQSKLNYLESTYYTRQPMTKIHTFYLELFKANDYAGARGGL